MTPASASHRAAHPLDHLRHRDDHDRLAAVAVAPYVTERPPQARILLGEVVWQVGHVRPAERPVDRVLPGERARRHLGAGPLGYAPHALADPGAVQDAAPPRGLAVPGIEVGDRERGEADVLHVARGARDPVHRPVVGAHPRLPAGHRQRALLDAAGHVSDAYQVALPPRAEAGGTGRVRPGQQPVQRRRGIRAAQRRSVEDHRPVVVPGEVLVVVPGDAPSLRERGGGEDDRRDGHDHGHGLAAERARHRHCDDGRPEEADRQPQPGPPAQDQEIRVEPLVSRLREAMAGSHQPQAPAEPVDHWHPGPPQDQNAEQPGGRQGRGGSRAPCDLPTLRELCVTPDSNELNILLVPARKRPLTAS